MIHGRKSASSLVQASKAARAGQRASWLRGVPVPAVASAYALSAVVFCAIMATGKAGFVDLQVYRMGGSAVLHQVALYALRLHGMPLPFTYPPFAAVLFAVAAAVPMPVAATALTAAGVAALPVLLYLALRLPPLDRVLDVALTWRLAFAAAAGAIWLEPVQSTLAYGQINLLLAIAVLYDLQLPDQSRWKGAAIGLAAGLKLTPAIFAIYYLLTRRYRAAVTSAATFGASVALGFALVPASSRQYWSGAFLRSSRVGQLDVGANESLAGALSRTLHTADVTAIWLPVALVVTVTGLVAAARAHRRGSEAAGFCVCALTGLLISPVSWTHHWVIAVPALLIGAVAAARAWPGQPLPALAGLAGIAAVTVVGWARLARAVGGDDWLHLTAKQILLTEPYVLAGLVALAVVAWQSRPIVAMPWRHGARPGPLGQDNAHTDMPEPDPQVSSNR